MRRARRSSARQTAVDTAAQARRVQFEAGQLARRAPTGTCTLVAVQEVVLGDPFLDGALDAEPDRHQADVSCIGGIEAGLVEGERPP